MRATVVGLLEPHLDLPDGTRLDHCWLAGVKPRDFMATAAAKHPGALPQELPLERGEANS